MSTIVIQEPLTGSIEEALTEVIVTLTVGNCPICSHSNPATCEGCKPQGIECLACRYRGPVPA